MALWFPIMVNQLEVGRVELVRTNPISHKPVEDEDCSYALKYYDKDNLRPSVLTTIKHPYKEANPVPLLSAALKKIEDQL